MDKIVSIIKTLFVSVITLITLTSCTNQKLGGAIIPHDLMAQKNIEAMYQKISNPHIQEVILISPNHHLVGHNYIQTTDIEPRFLDKEHGLFVHIPYIKQYFPNAKITEVMVKHGTPEDRLISFLKTLKLENVFVIASIDFSHNIPTEIAESNDKKIIDQLNNNTQIPFDTLKELAITENPESAYDAVAMDSPESLYLITRILKDKKFNLFKRDYSGSVSHILGEFL